MMTRDRTEQSTRALLHPVRPAGVRGPLSRLPGIELEAPESEVEFLDAVRSRPPSILIAPHWSQDYWTSQLRWVAAIGAGYSSFPVQRFEGSDVVLTTAKGLTASAVAEHAFALLLALARRVPEIVDAGHEKSWNKVAAHLELSKSRLVVLGLGEIGERIARIGAGFGMTVAGVRRDPHGYEGVATEVYSAGDIADAVRGADVVVSALPGGDATASLLTGEVFDQMAGGYFINVGRGSVVDEDALVRALSSGVLRGAGLDVVASEPLDPGSPLWSLKNVLISPHVGGSTPNYGQRWVALFARNLEAFQAKGPWRNRVV